MNGSKEETALLVNYIKEKNKDDRRQTFLARRLDGTLLLVHGPLVLTKLHDLPLKIEQMESKKNGQVLARKLSVYADSAKDKLTLIELALRHTRSAPVAAGDKVLAAKKLPMLGLLGKMEENIEVLVKAGVNFTCAVIMLRAVETLCASQMLYQMMAVEDGRYTDYKRLTENVTPLFAYQKMMVNPYELIPYGLSYDLADRIARSQLAFDKEDERRLQAILYHAIGKCERTGSTAFPYINIQNQYKKIEPTLSPQCMEKVLFNCPGIIYDRFTYTFYKEAVYQAEVRAASQTARLYESRFSLGAVRDDLIARIEKEMKTTFGRDQREAFNLCKETGIKVLTGGPGTGKTSTLNGLLRYLEAVYQEKGKIAKILLAAPSGEASHRMAKATGRPAQTLHRMLKLKPGETKKGLALDADIIVIDESSMMGLEIFATLVSSCKDGALLLLIGDVNQLPSVEPGNVLADMLGCRYVAYTMLEETFRQSEGSKICVDAVKVLGGDTSLEAGDDVFIYRTTSDRESSMLVQKLVKSELERDVAPDDIQILCPMRSGQDGVLAMNNTLKTLLGPSQGVERFRIGDRIITMRNNYEYDYLNGSLGKLVDIQKEGEEYIYICCFDGEDKKIPSSLSDDMALGYALTVHKSQGSEYKVTILVLPEDPYHFVDAQLLYTAITRAKSKLLIVSNGNALEKAIQNRRDNGRISYLTERVEELINKKRNERA